MGVEVVRLRRRTSRFEMGGRKKEKMESSVSCVQIESRRIFGG
jgi:hypothetical protein